MFLFRCLALIIRAVCINTFWYKWRLDWSIWNFGSEHAENERAHKRDEWRCACGMVSLETIVDRSGKTDPIAARAHAVDDPASYAPVS